MPVMVYPAVMLLSFSVAANFGARDTMAMTIGEMTERLNRASDSAYGRSALSQASTTALLTIRQLKAVQAGPAPTRSSRSRSAMAPEPSLPASSSSTGMATPSPSSRFRQDGSASSSSNPRAGSTASPYRSDARYPVSSGP